MKKGLKKMLGLAFLLSWAGTALTADAPGSGQASGSLPPTTPPASQCAAPSCDGHGPIDLCCPACSGNCSTDLGGGLIIGFDWPILRPVVNDNRALTVTTTNAVGTVSSTVQQNFQYKFQGDPNIWLGYRTDCGLGFTVTWFHLDNSSDTITATLSPIGLTSFTFPSPAGNLVAAEFLGAAVPFTFNSDLKMDIWDFDVTQRVEVCHFDLTFGGGIRYMHIGQDFSATASVPGIPRIVGTPGTFTDNLSNTFDGGGPTIILDGLRRFGNSGFGLYANARGGVLFGDRRDNGTATASSVLTSLEVGLGGLLRASVASDNEETLGFGELEMGLQWGRRMGPVSPYARIGFQGREYWGVGNAVNAVAVSNSSAVGAYGVAFAGGVGW